MNLILPKLNKKSSEDNTTKINTLIVRNSFCELLGFDPEVMSLIEEALTYKNDIEMERQNLIRAIRIAKAGGRQKQYGFLCGKLKELLASEYVCWLKDGRFFPTGHLNIVKDLLTESKVVANLLDERKKPDSYAKLRWKKLPYEPRYYQADMISLGKAEGRGVFESAVGTGKTLVMQYLIQHFSVNTLIIAPSKPLLRQLRTELEECFGRSKVEHVTSAKVGPGAKFKPIRITTVQTLASLRKKKHLIYLTKDLDALFIDEFHHAGSKSYTDLLKDLDQVYYRFGFTGTFLRNDNKTLDMWGVLSNRLYSYKASQAIADGFLTPLKVLVHSVEGVANKNYQTEYKKNYCREREAGGEELLQKIEFIVTQLAESTDQILILVNRKDSSGKIIHDYLDSEGIDNTYISGDDKADAIEQAIKDFNDKKVRILIGTTVIGEGIDIRSTDHLIMAKGGKSEIDMVQSTGRAVRLFPGKKVAYLHDFRFRMTRYMEKHLARREEIYQDNFSPEFTYID
jgi:superfamily II DNA or RNA helicase